MLATLFDREESLRFVARLARLRVRTRKVIRARALGATRCHGRLRVLQTDPERGLAFGADIFCVYLTVCIAVIRFCAWVITTVNFQNREPFRRFPQAVYSLPFSKFLSAATSSVQITCSITVAPLARAGGPGRFDKLDIRVRLPHRRPYKRPNRLDSTLPPQTDPRPGWCMQ